MHLSRKSGRLETNRTVLWLAIKYNYEASLLITYSFSLYIPFPHSSISYSPIPLSPIPHSHIPLSPIPHTLIPLSPIPHSPIPLSPIPHSPIPLSPTPHLTIPHSPISVQSGPNSSGSGDQKVHEPVLGSPARGRRENRPQPEPPIPALPARRDHEAFQESQTLSLVRRRPEDQNWK